jgi:VCBS repeat protein
VKNTSESRFKPGMERLEEREVPAFLSPMTSPGGGVRLAVGDFNHDGRDDIAALKGTILSSGAITDVIRVGGGATISLSAGNGSFQKTGSLSGAKGYYLGNFTVSDRNGDGDLDITLYTFDRRLDPVGVHEPVFRATAYDNVWLGKGDGTFARVSITVYPHQQTIFNSWPPIAFKLTAAGDYNHDGLADRATIDGSGISVELRNANGTYQPPQTYVAGPSPSAIAAGDFNGDGWADIVVVNNVSSNSPTLSVLFNDGNW